MHRGATGSHRVQSALKRRVESTGTMFQSENRMRRTQARTEPKEKQREAMSVEAARINSTALHSLPCPAHHYSCCTAPHYSLLVAHCR